MRRFVARGEFRVLDDRARVGHRGQIAELSDGSTHYQLARGHEDGPLTVLVPGLTVPLDFWDDVADRLHDGGFSTLAYSAYGRGLSDRVDGPYDPRLFVRQLSELLVAVSAREIHLVGTSMGALIALRFARQPTVPVLSLTLCGPAGFTSAERNPLRSAPAAAAVLAGRYLLRRRLLSHLERNVSTRPDANRLRSLVEAGFEFEGTAFALLSTLRSFPLAAQQDLFRAAEAGLPPTLLLWGADDRVTPVADFDLAAQLLRAEARYKVPNCGHMVPFERPDAFAEHVLPFLTKRSEHDDRSR